MPNTFLAEDFRRLLDALDGITEADADKKKDPEPKKDDVEDVLTSKDEDKDDAEADSGSELDNVLVDKLPHDLKKDAVEDIEGLINYLDQFPKLKRYRDPNASFDDAFYKGLPLEVMVRVSGMSPEDLRRIEKATKPYSGAIWLHDGTVTLFGKG